MSKIILNKMLLQAVKIGDIEIIEMLIKKGADLTKAKGRHGTSILMIAIRAKQTKIVRFLIEKSLLDVNYQNAYGGTALIYASSLFYTNILKLLLNAGADPNLANNSDTTPLKRAIQSGRIETVKLLLEYGADLYRIDNSRKSPLSYAYESYYSMELVPLLEGYEIAF